MFIPEYPEFFWLTAIIAVIFVGIAKSGLAGGAGVIGTPLMALTIPVTEAAALLLPLLICIDFLTISHYWREVDRPSLRLLLPSAVVGIVLGGLLFSLAIDNDRLLKIGIGGLALLFVLFQVTRSTVFGLLEAYRPPKWLGMLMGGISGFTSTLVHAGGPPVAIYLLPQKFSPQVLVATTVGFFTVVNLLKLIPYSLLGLLQIGNLTTVLILAPLCFVGVRLGIFLNGRIDPGWFNRIVYTLLFLTGIQLISGQNIFSLISGGV